ncbi:MAG: hypothetical protein IK055_11075, partial [Lachnospiraceae bacterium]|nr:hypothetical protein [Lachnospiraceae bacterium]
FTERVNELYEACGVSTILVIGGSGEYLSIADSVYMMDEYVITNVTKEAKALGGDRDDAEQFSENALKSARWSQSRQLLAEGFTPYPEQAAQEKLAVPDIGFILIGDEKIDTRMIQNILCQEQRTAIGFMIRLMEIRQNTAKVCLTTAVERLLAEIEEKGLDAIYSGFFPECDRFLAMPRLYDLYAVINRMRKLTYTKIEA